MVQKKAFITGINGQDGSYLAEYLLSLGYEVHGMIRRNSMAENQDSRLLHLSNKVVTHYGDLMDVGSIDNILHKVMPDEIYNIGAQSHVRISFEIPQFTVQANALGVLNM
jgi:GDPmannose 4,6-dehydratase